MTKQPTTSLSKLKEKIESILTLLEDIASTEQIIQTKGVMWRFAPKWTKNRTNLLLDLFSSEVEKERKKWEQSKNTIKIQEIKGVWNCHFRLGTHEVGCPHKNWSHEQLLDALETIYPKNGWKYERIIRILSESLSPKEGK